MHFSLFISLFIFHPIYYLRPSFSLSLLVVAQIRGHIAGSSPPLPTTVRALHFYRENTSTLSSLIDSRRIAPIHAPTSFFFCLQNKKISSKYHSGGIRTSNSRTNAIITIGAFEGTHQTIGATVQAADNWLVLCPLESRAQGPCHGSRRVCYICSRACCLYTIFYTGTWHVSCIHHNRINSGVRCSVFHCAAVLIRTYHSRRKCK